MKFKVLLIVALALCLSAPVALAAPGFQDFTTADINQNGTPY